MPRCFLVLLLLLSLSCSAPAEQASPLAGHPSPYLAMHAGDPVRWRTWHPDVLDEAQREGRLVFVSIGYFACHWCHVMQRESYQDADIATRLNRFTLPVKVDRELHPALDAQLIEFVRSTRGHAGWPLNVFLTPEGYPLLGLVYAPRDDFLALVQGLESAWREDREEMTRLAREAMLEMSAERRVAAPVALEGEALRVAFKQALWEAADDLEGGLGNQARFPNVPILRVLIERQASHPEPRREAFLRLTLRQMARLGLRDHLGGGFFRYTTDPGWRIPHFEKMLYDNAQLLGLYARAARVLQEPEWLQVAEHTFDFLQVMMRAPNGGYRSSLSSLDGDGVEGGYYLWSAAQLEQLLDERERGVAELWYGLQGTADFAAGHLPMRGQNREAIRAGTGLSDLELQRVLATIEATLLEARGQRTLPRDDKQLAAWNGLLLQGLVELARASGAERHRQAARDLRDFILRHFIRQDGLYRMWDAGGYAVRGDLEDYAHVAAGLLAWSEFAGAEEDAQVARGLVRQAWQRFHGPGGWRLTGEALLALPEHHPVIADGALPSPAATLLSLSAHLPARPGEDVWRKAHAEALDRSAPYVAADPLAHASYIPVFYP